MLLADVWYVQHFSGPPPLILACWVRLGLHLTELAAARAYDRVAIKKWGPEAAADKINFPVGQYDLAELETISMGDLVTNIRGASRALRRLP